MCNAQPCDSPEYAKGLCKYHYRQSWYQSNKDRVRRLNHEYYVANSDKYKASARKRQKHTRSDRCKALSLLVIGLKAAPCVDCNQSYHYCVMDFDHVPSRGKKLFNITDGIRKPVTKTKLLAEIAKCDLVCANCHRLRSFNRQLGDNNGVFK